MEEPEGTIKYNDVVKLRCVVDGADRPYFIQWQYMKDTNEDSKLPLWENIDCVGEVYEYVLTEENIDYYYRVVLSFNNDEKATKTDLNITSKSRKKKHYITSYMRVE